MTHRSKITIMEIIKKQNKISKRSNPILILFLIYSHWNIYRIKANKNKRQYHLKRLYIYFYLYIFYIYLYIYHNSKIKNQQQKKQNNKEIDKKNSILLLFLSSFCWPKIYIWD